MSIGTCGATLGLLVCNQPKGHKGRHRQADLSGGFEWEPDREVSCQHYERHEVIWMGKPAQWCPDCGAMCRTDATPVWIIPRLYNKELKAVEELAEATEPDCRLCDEDDEDGCEKGHE